MKECTCFWACFLPIVPNSNWKTVGDAHPTQYALQNICRHSDSATTISMVLTASFPRKWESLSSPSSPTFSSGIPPLRHPRHRSSGIHPLRHPRHRSSGIHPLRHPRHRSSGIHLDLEDGYPLTTAGMPEKEYLLTPAYNRGYERKEVGDAHPTKIWRFRVYRRVLGSHFF